ncbi:exclusion suppressor FxsA [Mycobacterium florentinum]|uniref:Exclusion suppressor FxsA n=1 Tax=Mycobacterium florentinum TaxID=292462 RepID=A0A1X1UH00_MYCFL|nr:FxsA family protein [Mycobacterium florentinum]MCV7412979.1 FxsA family protein [Mycobacterium florentinum]ORV56110.1 exclusion suppressor FxsA [Mycobacterium florentinum]BBX76496.1 membrane protein FxsA [Mycobacterium florentinum]
MVSRLLLLYAVVELAAIFALVWTVGWGWTLLGLLVTFVLGWGLLAPIAGSQLIRDIGRMRSGLKEPRTTLGDGALVTMATALVLVPGFVTTVLGMLLLFPPVRSGAGPGLTRIALRNFQRHAPLVSYTSTFSETFTGYRPDSAGAGRDFIDGEVIDVHDVEPPAFPKDRPGDEHWGGPRYAAGPN